MEVQEMKKELNPRNVEIIKSQPAIMLNYTTRSSPSSFKKK
jgi:hypothetical protein